MVSGWEGLCLPKFFQCDGDFDAVGSLGLRQEREFFAVCYTGDWKVLQYRGGCWIWTTFCEVLLLTVFEMWPEWMG